MLTFIRGAGADPRRAVGFLGCPRSLLFAHLDFGEQEPLRQAGRMGYFFGGTCRKQGNLELSWPRPWLEPKQHEVMGTCWGPWLGTAVEPQEFLADPCSPWGIPAEILSSGLGAESRVLSSAASACVFCLLLQ